MRIVFLGTPEFAVPSLEVLAGSGYEIAAVVTAPGKQAGRGLQLRQSAVKIYADRAGLPVLQPEKLSDPVFLHALEALRADLFVVVAFRMLPEKVWKMPRLGTFNLHASLLPQYRGAAPINRAIMNGETETGVTTFFLRQEIDTGAIIFREKTSIHPDETAGELHDRLKITGAALVLKTVKAIESGQVPVIEQNTLTVPGAILKPAPKIFADDCRIVWTRTALQIHNQVRGLSPYPGAFSRMKNPEGPSIIVKIFRSALGSVSTVLAPGTLHSEGSRLYAGCGDGVLEILELQQEGKKRMASAEFLKGFRMDKGWVLTSDC